MSALKLSLKEQAALKMLMGISSVLADEVELGAIASVKVNAK